MQMDGKLLKHLSDELVDVGRRFEKATTEVVELQPKLLMQRVQFQGAVIEPTFDRSVTQATPAARWSPSPLEEGG